MLVPGSQLGHYAISSALGAGGMGAVFRARDSVLERMVAIKVLTQNSDDSAERVLREAQAASALNHPNICTVHEVGEADGEPYMVMELIDGQPLHTIIPPGGLLHDTAIDYGLQIVGALAHAHSRGIVHGDLKSANVMVTADGHVKVLDFGLARRLAAENAEHSSQMKNLKDVSELLTISTGNIVGTLAYMAPEILDGHGVDVSADIWAFGVLLYEMCTKNFPFVGDLHSDTVAAILRDPPRPLPSSVSPSLTAAIMQCLVKARVGRFQSAADVRRALERAREDTATLRGTAKRPRRAIDSIAVLPFVNPAADPDTEYLCDGVAATLISNLSRLRRLRVIPKTLSSQYARDTSLRIIARELNVRSILTGSIRRRADDLLIEAELVDVDLIKHLWGGRYQRSIGDLSDVEEDIAREITTSLQLALTGPEKKRLTRRSTRSSEAYQEFLKGRFHLEKRNAAGFKNALAHFQQALEHDPSYALPYAGLADCFALLGAPEHGVMPAGEAMPRARAAAQKALEIDPTLGEPHAALGWVKFRHEWDWHGAIQAFDRSIALNPNQTNVRFWRAYYLASIERFSEALAEIRRAQAIDPLSLILNAAVGWMLYFKGDDEEALAAYQGVLEIQPNFMIVHWGVGQLYERQGRYDLAIEAYRRSAELSRGNLAQQAALGHACAMAGQRAEAEQILSDLLNAPAANASPFKIAAIKAALGDDAGSFEWLDRAVTEHDGWMTTLKIAHEMAPLRDDPRFAALIARVGFPKT